MQNEQQVILTQRPVGLPTSNDFQLVSTAPCVVADKQVKVAVRYISLDPAMRGWMSDLPSYLPPVRLGAVMRAYGVGVVVESRDENWPVGTLVSGMTGVRSHWLAEAKKLTRLPDLALPLSTFVGPLGIPGLSAYFGLLDVGHFQAGQTVLVSGAAGAVGSMVGQIARLKGGRAVGIAGGPEKCRHLVDDLGFDAAIDYKNDSVRHALKAKLSDGIDVYFDNVGGEILDAALARLKIGARVVICGAISQYNATTRPKGPQNYLALLIRRARMEGFLVTDYVHRYPEALNVLGRWLADGKLLSRETVVDGLDQFVPAFNRLFSGEKLGKLALKP
ncbi:MAG: NADP-dependent oxidoreductase [Myxococcota bacterium]|nr:NADP-dependent oxidoreductase [Myxococcota bacterium]